MVGGVSEGNANITMGCLVYGGGGGEWERCSCFIQVTMMGGFVG